MLRKFFREPLVHFLFLGALLFVMFNIISGKRGGAGDKVVVTDAIVTNLMQTYQQSWQRLPTPSELKGLVDTYIREEILYRDGVSMKLDVDDSVIRRRVLQKLDVITEQSSDQSPPTDAELEAYLKAHVARYSPSALIDFEQVLFDPVKEGKKLDTDLTSALTRLRAGEPLDAVAPASLLPHKIIAAQSSQINRDYGEEFGHFLLTIPVGEWRGPVPSGYGLHLVRVTKEVPASVPSLSEVRPAVERDWENERRLKSKEEYYEKLKKQYHVVIVSKLFANYVPQVK